MKLLVLSWLLSLASPMLYLQHLIVTPSALSFTFSFPQPFLIAPTFVYFIESADINGEYFCLELDSTTLSTTTSMNISFKPNQSPSTSLYRINVAVLVSNQPSKWLYLTMLTFNSFQMVIVRTIPDLSNSIAQDSFIQIYSLAYPLDYTSTLSPTNLSVAFSKMFENITLAVIEFSRMYLSNNVFAVFSTIKKGNLGCNLLFPKKFVSFQLKGNTGLPANLFFAFKKLNSKTMPLLECSMIFLGGRDSTSIIGSLQVGYQITSGVVDVFAADVIIFNSSASCPVGTYFFYPVYYSSLPSNCLACHPICLTCVSTRGSLPPYKTTNQTCTSCFFPMYLSYGNDYFGKCLCYPGLQFIAPGVCSLCLSNCLTFAVYYIQTTTTAQFMLLFSFQGVVMQIDIADNMQAFVNGNPILCNISNIRDGYYIIRILPVDMQPCSIACKIVFLFLHPELILKSTLNESLCMNNFTLSLKGYISYYQDLPKEVTTSLSFINYAVQASMSSGLTSFVKILFGLEQIIECHKYMNVTLPVVFNTFILAINNFKFLDVTALFPNELNSALQSLSSSKLDNMGPPLLIYYGNGANFYRNFVSGIVSFIVMLVLTYFIYTIFKHLPSLTTHKLAQKIRLRKIIIIHDSFEGLVLPIIIYSQAQLSVVVNLEQFWWVYGLSFSLTFITIVTPFFVITYIMTQPRKSEMRQIYEDLLQDGSLDYNITLVFYLLNYYQKVGLGLILTWSIPGIVQLLLAIALNLLLLFILVYVAWIGSYLSKVKLIIRFTYVCCFIVIQALILLYNIEYFSEGEMIIIGAACLYISLGVTVLSIVEFIIKVGDSLRQGVSIREKEVAEPTRGQPLDLFTKNRIKCSIGQTGTFAKMPTGFSKELADDYFVQVSDNSVSASQSNGDELVYIEDEQEDEQHSNQPEERKPEISLQGELELVYVEQGEGEPVPQRSRRAGGLRVQLVGNSVQDLQELQEWE